MLFRLLDVDDSGVIDVDEFVSGCMRMQGDAKSIDVHTMIFQVQQFLAKWAEFTSFVEDRLGKVLPREGQSLSSVKSRSRSGNLVGLHLQHSRSLTGQLL